MFDSRQPSQQIWLKDFGRSIAAFSLDGATDRRTDTDTNLYFHSSSPLTTTILPGAILHQDEQETRLTMANSTDRTRASPYTTSQSRSNSEPTSQALTPNTELSGQLGDRGKRQASDPPQDPGYSKEQYKRDAALIQHVAMLMKEEGRLPHLQPTTQQADRDMANSVCFLMDKNTYARHLDRAKRIVAEQTSSTQDSNAWRVFCTRFRGGPTGRVTPEPGDDNPDRSLKDPSAASLDPSGRLPESPPIGCKTHTMVRTYPTPQLRISPLYGEEREYAPGEDDDYSDPEEWDIRYSRLNRHRSNESLEGRLRRLEDDSQQLTQRIEASNPYSRSRQASYYSSR